MLTITQLIDKFAAKRIVVADAEHDYKYCYSLSKTTLLFATDDCSSTYAAFTGTAPKSFTNTLIVDVNDYGKLKELSVFTVDYAGNHMLYISTLYELISRKLDLPKPKTEYIHYKSREHYILAFISKSGDKESDQLYITYYQKDESGLLYTRTLEDFFATVTNSAGQEVERFILA